nr:zinc metalloproteinase nas-7 isoform X1 [Drosophila virilis]
MHKSSCVGDGFVVGGVVGATNCECSITFNCRFIATPATASIFVSVCAPFSFYDSIDVYFVSQLCSNIKASRRSGAAFDFWTENSASNIWEHCGLFEGDIMLHRELLRNGLLNERQTWPDAAVPFYIDPEDFTANQTMVILKAFKEYHERSCIRFRPYEKGDKHWLLIKGNYSGCWSSVGRRQGGQILNLNTPKCVTHGVVVHELLHALGFYHQQSATERDEYVKINWENILDGHAHNFNKYARTHITNFGVEYDYQSVMHYSSLAFSKNGKATIEPLDPYASLGQRRGLSDKDISKLNEMYEQDCNGSYLLGFDGFSSYLDELLDYFQGNLEGLFG